MTQEYTLVSEPNRLKAYNIFKNYFFPFVSITCEIEITGLISKVKQKNLKFSQAISYIILKATNNVPEFRYRIINDQVVEYKSVGIGPIALTDDNNLKFLYIPNLDWNEFALKYEEQLKDNGEINFGELSVVYISCVPWFAQTGLVTPIRSKDTSIPAFTVGKYFTRDSGVFIPLTIQVHHGLMDGFHIHRFLEELALVQKEF